MFNGVLSGLVFLLLSLSNLVLFSTGLTFEPCKPADPDYKSGGILTGEWLKWAKFYSYCLQVTIMLKCFVTIYFLKNVIRYFPNLTSELKAF